jgi:NitT/TauT family transport system substrate-binding protein
VAALAAVGLVLAACTTGTTPPPTGAQTATPTAPATAAPTPSRAPTTVRFLTSAGGLGDWGAYVAAEKGYFREEGIDFQLNTFQSYPDIYTSIISGQGDIATSNINYPILGALASAPIKLISATQVQLPGGSGGAWATLPTSPITRVADLRGKKVHIFSQNSLAQAVTRKVLSNAGIAVGEFQEIALPFPQAFTAVESGQTDVSYFIEPFLTNSNALSASKYGSPLRVIFTNIDAFPGGLNPSGMFANTDWLRSNPDAARAFLRAYLRAQKWGTENREELLVIIAKYAGVPHENIRNAPPSAASLDGRFVPGFLRQFQELMISYQMIPNLTSPLPEDQFVDLSYLS